MPSNSLKYMNHEFNSPGQTLTNFGKTVGVDKVDQEISVNGVEVITLNSEGKPMFYSAVTAVDGNIDILIEEFPFEGDFGDDDVSTEIESSTIISGSTIVARSDISGGMIKITLTSASATSVRIRAITN